MDKKVLVKKIVGLVISLFIFVSATFICINAPINGYRFGNIIVPGGDASFFRYFTNLSNLYAGIVSLIVFIFSLIHFKEDYVLPKWLRVVQLTAVTSLVLTFLTVLVFIAPTFAMNGNNYFDMFMYDMFFFHFFNPVLIFIVFLFFSKGDKLNWIECLFGVIPMVVYGIFYSIVVLSGIMEDFYGFTFGGKYWLLPIVIPVMLGATYLISFLSSFIYNKIEGKKEK